MKYKDYLIFPVILVYLVFASCAFIAQKTDSEGAVPVPSVDPYAISWGGKTGEYGEYWYADGARGTECFSVATSSSGVSNICFLNNGSDGKGVSYIVSDMHMKCKSGGKQYDLIFVDEMTAYDTVTGTYYQRADYSTIIKCLTSGKFVNADNPKDYYVFKENGKSVEYFGDRVFKGRWNLATSDTISVFDNRCKQNFEFDLLFDYGGEIRGFNFNDVSYILAA